MKHFSSRQRTGRFDPRGEVQIEKIKQVIAESEIADLLEKEAPPVDIERIAFALGAESVGVADIPFAGVLLPSGDSFKILANRHHDLVRQRFSYAHELAHVLFNTGDVAMRHSPTSHSSEIEKSCEALAALLLMPDPAFSESSRGEPAGIERIIDLARSFATSIQATAMRYVDVVRESCVLIVSEMQQNADLGLRIRWSHQNTRRYDGRSVHFVPNGMPMRVRTALAAHRANGIKADTEKLNQGGLRLKAYTESMGFGSARGYRYVLTLVFPDR